MAETKTVMRINRDELKELIERKHNVKIAELTLSQKSGAKCLLQDDSN